MDVTTNRIGIIAPTPLVQHQLQVVIDEAGYEVAINTSPERIDRKDLTDPSIRLWVVELEDDGQWTEFIQDIVECVDKPVLFGDAIVPSKNDEGYVRWRNRIQRKLHSLVPTQPSAPTINLDSLTAKPSVPVFELPDSLRDAPSTNIDTIWVLCASLGGPQAVKDFLDLLPENIPTSFLYAQHIDEGCVDALVQSVGRHTKLNMVLADHGQQIENGNVYVVPVNHEITFTENHGILWQNSAWHGPYGPSLDHLLDNVVKRYGAKCHTIIFSGMGSDGTLGARLVKDAQGTVWAQSELSCIQSSMPDSAEDAGLVEWRGTPVDLAEKLIKWLAENTVQTANLQDETHENTNTNPS